MQNYPSAWGPGTTRSYGAVAPDTLGKVMGLLGVASIFTALGALFGATSPNRGLFWLGLIGSLGCLLALFFVKERAPLNLVLLYGFATFEGILLGQIVMSYIASGQGVVVVDAGATTAVVALGAGAYGYTTKRNLTSLGGILFMALLVLLAASFIGIFLHPPGFVLGISVLAAVLFTGFLVYDLNRIANAGQVSQGDAILLAVSVYLDVLNLFLALLRIFGIFSSRD